MSDELAKLRTSNGELALQLAAVEERLETRQAELLAVISRMLEESRAAAAEMQRLRFTAELAGAAVEALCRYVAGSRESTEAAPNGDPAGGIPAGSDAALSAGNDHP